MSVSLKHIRQIICYGVIGAIAWIAQTISFVWLIHLALSPILSMFMANFVGMFVAYLGHVKFTFKSAKPKTHREFIKFVMTSMVGLLFNLLGVKLVVNVLDLNAHYAIIPTLLVPILTFLISKFWVFNTKAE